MRALLVAAREREFAATASGSGERGAGSARASARTRARSPERPEAREKRRVERLRASGLEANRRGQVATAYRLLLQAALLEPSASMLLSVANMQLKLGRAALAMPLYVYVAGAASSGERERRMAERKMQQVGGTSGWQGGGVAHAPCGSVGDGDEPSPHMAGVGGEAGGGGGGGVGGVRGGGIVMAWRSLLGPHRQWRERW